MGNLKFADFARIYAPKVDAFLEEHWREVRGRREGDFCVTMARYHLATGGKRLRGVLPVYMFHLLGKKPDDALPVGAAAELIHNATLIHDDLQDGDPVRRGKPTVWKHFSPAQAINGGDALFFHSLEVLGKAAVEPSRLAEIQRIAAGCTLDVIEGQAQEFLMKAEENPGIARYFQVISGKTSGLFKLPILAALAAAGRDTMVSAARRASAGLGKLFQIQDDYLDLYGEKQRDRPGRDIAEGKISFFVAYVNDHGSARERRRLSGILKKPREKTTDAHVAEALDIFESTGAKNAAEEIMKEIKRDLDVFPGEPGDSPLKILCSEMSELFLSYV